MHTLLVPIWGQYIGTFLVCLTKEVKDELHEKDSRFKGGMIHTYRITYSILIGQL